MGADYGPRLGGGLVVEGERATLLELCGSNPHMTPLLAWVLLTAIAQGPDTAVARIQSELAERYRENEAGFFARDPDRVMRLRHPEFHTIGPDGRASNREQMYERTRAFIGRVERFDSLAETITALTLSGDTAHAIVHQQTVRQQRFPDGKLHEIRTRVVQRESWIRTRQGWLMWRVDQVQPGQTLVDGRPPP
jgi:hypothetical protein